MRSHAAADRPAAEHGHAGEPHRGQQSWPRSELPRQPTELQAQGKAYCFRPVCLGLFFHSYAAKPKGYRRGNEIHLGKWQNPGSLKPWPSPLSALLSQARL